MEWNKAGRPRKNPAFTMPKVEVEADDEPWTKEERTIAANGIVSMAAAVIRQWIKDGKPQRDYFGVLPWINLLKEYFAEQDKKYLAQNLMNLINA